MGYWSLIRREVKMADRINFEECFFLFVTLWTGTLSTFVITRKAERGQYAVILTEITSLII